MAADQRKRKLNGNSILYGNSQEQSRATKKRLGSTLSPSNISPHIALEWNERQNCVVPKREQICLSRRNLPPFNKLFPSVRSILADVCVMPSEIFELDNVNGVVSYEVWQTLLSEKERDLLIKFLPEGIEVEQVVQSLLSGDNFHFGNPFHKWGSSLCSGHLHPDAIRENEKYLSVKKNGYYSELKNYHDDMIGDLQNMKEMWETCDDPEKKIVQNILRSRKHDRKCFSSSNGYKLLNAEEHLGATSESCSEGTDDKECSSDNQINSIVKSGLSKRRYMEDKCQDSLFATVDGMFKAVSRPSKVDKFNKQIVRGNDGSKYMSYVKVSKKQFELFKSMKQSGKSIQSSSLNHVLGDPENFLVRPYEVFEEEERTKLHEHWVQVANIDLPASFAQWKKVQIHRCQVTKSLGQDFKEKLKSLVKDEEQNYVDSEIHTENNDLREDDKLTLEGGEDFVLASTNTHVEQIHSLNVMPLLNPVNLDSEHARVITARDVDSEINHVVCKRDNASPDVLEYTGNVNPVNIAGNANPVNIAGNQGVSLSSAEDLWLPQSFYNPNSRYEYTTSSGLSHGHPQIVLENQPCLIDLSNLHVQNARENILQLQSNNGDFSSYQNQEQRELFQPFFRGQDMSSDQGILSYNHEQKLTGFGFQQSRDVLMGSNHLPEYMLDQQPPLKTQNYFNVVRPNIQDNMFNDGGTYFNPRERQHISPVNMQDYAINPIRMQSYINGVDPLGQISFSSQPQGHGNWSGLENHCFPSQSTGIRGNNDESLFSVPSHGKELSSHSLTPFDCVGSAVQFLSPRNIGMMNGGSISANPINFGMMKGGISGNINMLPQTSNPSLLDYMSGVVREPATSQMTTNNMDWLSLPHPNSALHDSNGRPYLRPWHQ